MRVEQQMMLTKQDVLDEELLFKNQKLSKKEKKELELKRETLNLAEERLKLSRKTDEYIMPEGLIFHFFHFRVFACLSTRNRTFTEFISMSLITLRLYY